MPRTLPAPRSVHSARIWLRSPGAILSLMSRSTRSTPQISRPPHITSRSTDTSSSTTSEFSASCPAVSLLTWLTRVRTAFHLEQFNTNVNQIPDHFIAQGSPAGRNLQPVTIAQKVCPLGNLCAAYPFNQTLPGSLGPAGLTVGQLDRPFPQYGGLNYNGFGCCGSSYNSLQATVTKRFQGGGTLLVAYTNAKLMSNTDTLTSWLEGGTTGGVGGVQDWNNLNGERSLSSAGCFAAPGRQLRP